MMPTVPPSVSKLKSILLFIPPISRSLHSSSFCASPTLTVRHFSPQTKNRKKVTSNVAPPSVPVPQRVAVVGAGLAGLSVVYHLLNSTDRYARKRNFDKNSIHITLFDPASPGTAGASAAAAGLLHEFRPRPKTKMWNHQKAIDAALHLLAIAETNGKKLVSTPGILKLAFDEKAEDDFRIAAGRFPKEVEYLSPNDMQQRFPHMRSDVPGLFIRTGHVVDTPSYLKSLWEICQASGRVTWCQRSISSAQQLFSPSEETGKPFDNVVLCAGAAIKQFTDLADLPISPCLGHNLVMKSQSENLETPLMAGTYLVPQLHSDGQLIAGATRNFKFSQLDDEVESNTIVEQVKEQLAERLLRLEPRLYDTYSVLATQTGIRAIPPGAGKSGTVPIVSQVKGTPQDRWCWIFTGMGGKGLIYHAFLGRRLAHAIVAGNESLIPGEARRLDIQLGLKI